MKWLALLVLVLFVALITGVHQAGAPPVPAAESPRVIVVLGARVLHGGVASPALQSRTEKAVALFHQLEAEKIFFSGGVGTYPPSEASVARDLAVKLGVPAAACVLEEESHSTLQNAAFTAPLLKKLGATRVLLVTDGFHLFRATRLFRDVGIEAVPVASDRPMSAPDKAWSTFREALAVVRRPWLLWS